MLVDVALLAGRVFASRIVDAPEHPLGGEQALDADGAAGVDAAGGDADLGPKAQPETVSKPDTVLFLINIIVRHFWQKKENMRDAESEKSKRKKEIESKKSKR